MRERVSERAVVQWRRLILSGPAAVSVHTSQQGRKWCGAANGAVILGGGIRIAATLEMAEDRVWFYYKTEGQPTLTSVQIKSGAYVDDLRKAIWEQEGKKLEKYGVLAASDLLLWKEGGEKSLEPDRVLTGGVDPVFKDGEKKKVSVTPVGAENGDHAFVVSDCIPRDLGSIGDVLGRPAAMSSEVEAHSMELAKAILVPFEHVPRTLDELRDALSSRPLRKLPLHRVFWDRVKMYEAAREIFELESSPPATVISCSVEAAYSECIKKHRYGTMDSAKVRQTLWDRIFCGFWETLLELAEIQSGLEYSRDQCSTSSLSSGRSRRDLSLLVYGKEVVYFEEDSGRASDAAQQARKKVKTLDPKYFKDMQYLVCVATKMTEFHVFASSPGKDWFPLINAQTVDLISGFCTAIKTSINFLRYALTWAPELETTPRKKILFTDTRKYAENIVRTIDELRSGVVKKTIFPWSKHEEAGYTKLAYVQKAMEELKIYAAVPPTVSKDLYTSKLKHMGVQKRPVDCSELKACLADILKSLAKLHRVNLVHRDIRWANIVYVQIIEMWWLIDFETVWESGHVPECALHCFEDVLGQDEPFDLKTDLKLVGRLISDLGSELGCDDLLDFEGDLLGGNFVHAGDALEALAMVPTCMEQ